VLTEPREELRLEEDLVEGDVWADELESDFGVLPNVTAMPDFAEVAIPEVIDEQVALVD
jgi:hypothetical protein